MQIAEQLRKEKVLTIIAIDKSLIDDRTTIARESVLLEREHQLKRASDKPPYMIVKLVWERKSGIKASKP